MTSTNAQTNENPLFGHCIINGVETNSNICFICVKLKPKVKFSTHDKVCSDCEGSRKIFKCLSCKEKKPLQEFPPDNIHQCHECHERKQMKFMRRRLCNYCKCTKDFCFFPPGLHHTRAKCVYCIIKLDKKNEKEDEIVCNTCKKTYWNPKSFSMGSGLDCNSCINQKKFNCNRCGKMKTIQNFPGTTNEMLRKGKISTGTCSSCSHEPSSLHDNGKDEFNDKSILLQQDKKKKYCTKCKTLRKFPKAFSNSGNGECNHCLNQRKFLCDICEKLLGLNGFPVEYHKLFGHGTISRATCIECVSSKNNSFYGNFNEELGNKSLNVQKDKKKKYCKNCKTFRKFPQAFSNTGNDECNICLNLRKFPCSTCNNLLCLHLFPLEYHKSFGHGTISSATCNNCLHKQRRKLSAQFM